MPVPELPLFTRARRHADRTAILDEERRYTYRDLLHAADRVAGQTVAGRYLFCVVIRFPNGRGFPVTARDMTLAERRRYLRWRKR